MKKAIKKIILIISLAFLMLNLSIVKADSGWDSDYDTGGSWDYGDSYDYDYDYEYGGSYSSSSSSGSPLGTIIFFIIVIIIIIIISKNNKNNGGGTGSSTKKGNNYKDLTNEELEKYEINSEEFKKLVYETYKEIQNAWTDLDYKKLRTKITDELYNSYTMQLDTLKLKHQKNIMSDFECLNTKIYNITEENGILNVNVYLNVKMYDYVIDKDNKVIRGTDKRRIDIEYELTFVKTNDKKKSKKETKCPNCGATIESVAGGTCEYCGSKVVEKAAKNFVMSRKTSIGQRFE